jgi:hypothetical protein
MPPPLSPCVQPGLEDAGVKKFPRLTCPKNPAVFNEIDGQQVYEMGSNFSGSPDRSDDGFREPTAPAQTILDPSESAADSKPQQETEQDTTDLAPPALAKNQGFDVALSTLRPGLTETLELKALGPIFGIGLELLYQRDGVFVPRVVQYCIAVAEQVDRQSPKLYDLQVDQDDVTYLKDRFDNGRPVQVNARAIFDHRTVDPRKLNFSKGDQILVIEPRDEKWFLGRRHHASGFFPTGFVQFSVKDIADIIGTCKAFFMDLPDSLIPKQQYASLVTAPGNYISAPVLLAPN